MDARVGLLRCAPHCDADGQDPDQHRRDRQHPSLARASRFPGLLSAVVVRTSVRTRRRGFRMFAGGTEPGVDFEGRVGR